MVKLILFFILIRFNKKINTFVYPRLLTSRLFSKLIRGILSVDTKSDNATAFKPFGLTAFLLQLTCIGVCRLMYKIILLAASLYFSYFWIKNIYQDENYSAENTADGYSKRNAPGMGKATGK